MGQPFKLNHCEGLVFRGDSEILAQITQELSCNPDSCFSQNVVGWYNSLYSELSDFDDCRYQVKTKPTEGEPSTPENLEDVINLILGFVEGNNRRVARASIRIICRQALRKVTENLAQDV